MNIKYFTKISIIYGITIVISSIAIGYNATTAQDIIDFESYKAEAKHIKNKTIPRTNLLKELTTIKDNKCKKEKESDSSFLVSPICLLRGDLPETQLQPTLDNIRSHIQGFQDVYQTTLKKFDYKGSQAIFDNKLENPIPQTNIEKAILIYLQKSGKTIRIPAKYLWKNTAEKFTFYVTTKDLTPLKKCTKQNYKVALNSFDNFTLNAGESINLNQHIAYREGYCKGRGNQDLMFFGGVCGFITQLFRTSLIMPDIDIVKRYAHSIWLVPYYSDYIFGDDAAIYENSKQFEIKNIGTRPIIFKILDKGDSNYLVATIGEKNTKGVLIQKEETGKLRGQIKRKIYDQKDNLTIATQKFNAIYDKKAYNVY